MDQHCIGKKLFFKAGNLLGNSMPWLVLLDR